MPDSHWCPRDAPQNGLSSRRRRPRRRRRGGCAGRGRPRRGGTLRYYPASLWGRCAGTRSSGVRSPPSSRSAGPPPRFICRTRSRPSCGSGTGIRTRRSSGGSAGPRFPARRRRLRAGLGVSPLDRLRATSGRSERSPMKSSGPSGRAWWTPPHRRGPRHRTASGRPTAHHSRSDPVCAASPGAGRAAHHHVRSCRRGPHPHRGRRRGDVCRSARPGRDHDPRGQPLDTRGRTLVTDALDGLEQRAASGALHRTSHADIDFQDALAEASGLARIGPMLQLLAEQLRMFISVMGSTTPSRSTPSSTGTGGSSRRSTQRTSRQPLNGGAPRWTTPPRTCSSNCRPPDRLRSRRPDAVVGPPRPRLLTSQPSAPRSRPEREQAPPVSPGRRHRCLHGRPTSSPVTVDTAGATSYIS